MKVKEEDLKRELEIAVSNKDKIVNCATRLGQNYKCFYRFVKRAKIHGVDAVLHSNQKHNHSLEFKMTAVKAVLEEKKSKCHVATQLNISDGLVRSWVKFYLEGGEERLRSDHRRSEMEKDKTKVVDDEGHDLEYYKAKAKKLERENLLLKKSLPLVQKILKERSQGKSDTSSSEN